MSQKSILSFFKQAPVPSSSDVSKTPEKTKKVEQASIKDKYDESPIKTQRKRKRLKQIIESDDESNSSDETPKKVEDSSPIQADQEKETLKNGKSKSEPKAKKTKKDSSPKSSKSEHSLTNGTSKQHTKCKKAVQSIESDEEENPVSESEKKIKIENEVDEDSKKDSTSNVSSESNTAINENETEDKKTVFEFIPKRKTARKQMRGGQKRMTLETENSFASPEKESEKENDSVINIHNESDVVDKTKSEISESQNAKKDEHSDTNNETSGKSSETSKESLEEIPETSKKIKPSSETKGKRKKSEISEEVEGEKTDEETKKRPKTDKKTKNSKTSKVTEKSKTTEKVKDQDSKAKNIKVQESKTVNVQDSKTEDIEQDSKMEDVEQDSKTEDVEQDSKTEEVKHVSSEKESSKTKSSKREDEASSNSKKSKALHPFFAAKKKESEATPVKDSVDKKAASKDVQSSSSGTSYDPSKNRYHPIDDACWKHNEKVPYLALAKTLELIENTSARLKMIEILANFLRSVIVLTPEDLLYSVYLCLNRLAPEYEGIELGVGEMLLMKAVAQATGRTVEKIKAEVAVKGDLGLVAESSRGNQRIMFAPPKLTVASVFSKFKEVAKMSGNSAMSKKTDKIQALFVACRECEAKYIIRSLSGKLRIGLAETSVLAALARAAVLTPPNQSYPPEIIDKSSKMSADNFKEHLNAQTLILKTTYCECPNFDIVIPVLLKEGIDALPIHCQLLPGCPLKPMLAHPTNGIDEVLNRFDKNEFTCEFKYDGERAQIHMTDKGEVKIFSRNQEDNTSKYPDVISRISKALKETTKSFILDSEAVAWDCESKQILPFQVLSTRKKKDAVESDIVVQVCIMAFDLLYINGESLVKKTLKERRELLHSSFIEVPNEFMFAIYRDGDSAETMQEFLDESVKGNCEGLMVKALTVDASYEIAKRSHNWLKLKKDYLKGVGDTLDLVVIGGYHGKGKRTGTYGGFLLACYDEENEEFQSICKLGTGFSEEELDTHTKFLKQHVIKDPKSYYRYDSSLEPDEWFEPVQIWEIKCADLSISPVHKAALGIVDPEKGISLRFPRFLRIRDDKTKPEDCTVATQIAEMYQNQEQVQNMKNKNVKPEEDYY